MSTIITEPYTLTIPYRKRWFQILFFSFIAFILFGTNKDLLNMQTISANPLNSVWLLVLGGFTAYSLAQFFFEKVIVTIDTDTMTVTYNLLGIKRARSYELSKISGIYIDKDKMEDKYWYLHRGGSPIRDPFVMNFNYNGNDESVGKLLAAFPAEELKSEIEKRQKHKPLFTEA